MKKKILIPIFVLVLLVVGGLSTFFLLRQPQQEVTLEQYQTKLESMVKNTRTGQEQWTNLLGGAGNGAGFQDICTGYYSVHFRLLGDAFITEANNFNTLRLKEGKPENVIFNYQSYQIYFDTYETIGTKLIAFSDHVDAGEYTAAISILEELISLYDTLPILY